MGGAPPHHDAGAEEDAEAAQQKARLGEKKAYQKRMGACQESYDQEQGSS